MTGTRSGRFQMLVTDIDGTLTTWQREISPAVHEAVRTAQQRGVRVLLATGRAWQSGRRYFERLQADPPGILFNGGLIYDFAAKRVLHRTTMTIEQAGKVIDHLDGFPELAAHLYIGDHIYVTEWTPLVDATAKQDHLEPEVVGDLRGALVGEPMKFRILGPRARLEALAELISKDGVPNYVYSEYESLEVLPPGVSKGAALRMVGRDLNVPLEAVVAVGNDFNDLSMIEAAGLGVAMADAPEAVREAADYVAPSSNEDGLAEVIHRFVLAPKDVAASE